MSIMPWSFCTAQTLHVFFFFEKNSSGSEGANIIFVESELLNLLHKLQFERKNQIALKELT